MLKNETKGMYELKSGLKLLEGKRYLVKPLQPIRTVVGTERDWRYEKIEKFTSVFKRVDKSLFGSITLVFYDDEQRYNVDVTNVDIILEIC